MEQERAYYLVAKMLDGSISSEEHSELTQWMAEDPSRESIVEDLRPILGAVSAQVNAPEPETNAEWAALLSRMVEVEEQKSTPVIPMRSAAPSASRRYWVAAAAAIIVMLGGYFAMRSMYSEKESSEALTFATAEGERKEISLPDGSKVHLNGGSSLVAEAGFGDEARRVRLEGEAFFQVTHDPGKPFEVTTGSTKTTVLGTQFNLRRYHAEDPVRLSVVEGKVRFAEPESGQEAVFVANESGSFDPATRRLSKSSDPAVDVAAWREGVLSFHDEALSAAIPRLNHFYDIQIRLGDGLKDSRLTARFVGTDAAAMLDVLATLYTAKVRREGKVVWLDK